MPVSSTSHGSRVLLAISSFLALLALGLPFALEPGSRLSSGGSGKLFGGTQVWSGWSLARASTSDARVPVPTAMVIALVVSTVGLVALAWLALDRPGAGFPVAAGAVGTALLVSSILIGHVVQGPDVHGHDKATSAWGLGVWRVALLLVVVAAAQAVLKTEREYGTIPMS